MLPLGQYSLYIDIGGWIASICADPTKGDRPTICKDDRHHNQREGDRPTFLQLNWVIAWV
jgi:hypothetical protein